MSLKLIDHHMHTQASPDADPNLSMEDYIRKAIECNYPGVMFTDHVDYDFAAPIFSEQIDYSQYYSQILKLRKQYNLPILMGVEMGYQPHLNAKIDALLNEFPFDLVILSIHMGDGLDLYNGDFFKGKTQNEAYMRYFEIVLDTVQNYENFDIFGHIDYIIRYGVFKNKIYDFDTFKPIITEILKIIIRNNKGIEVNTSGYRYGLGVTHPILELLKLYKSLGGKILTLGSDAHYLKDYQRDFDEALRLIRLAGFSEVTHFKNRKPYVVSIE